MRFAVIFAAFLIAMAIRGDRPSTDQLATAFAANAIFLAFAIAALMDIIEWVKTVWG